MTRVLMTIALRLVLCACVIYPVWRVLGASGIVVGSPLFGIALAKPLINLFSELRAVVREHSLRQIEGRFFAYRGGWIDVVEDVEHGRWLRLQHVRRVVPGLMSDGALLRHRPLACRRHGRPAFLYLRDTALLELLAQATSVDTLKFRHWIEREVAFPAERLKRRAQVAEPPADRAGVDSGPPSSPALG